MNEPKIKIRDATGKITTYVPALFRVDSFREGTNIPEEINLILPDDVIELNHAGTTHFITGWIPEGKYLAHVRERRKK